MDKALKYEPYEHLYKPKNILCLKGADKIKEIDILLKNQNKQNYRLMNNAIWYLTEEKRKILFNHKLKVINCISWHMGIPFYELKITGCNSEGIFVGEFYLESL